MRIAEPRGPPGTGATTTAIACTGMTEEGRRRPGMNGTNEGPDEPPPRGHYTQGGRLKFFKDGKFILELERAREGERVQWVSVPRKTYWPPQGNAASTPTYRQESSTSLSVSDDNSSIQSSPWQRDHSWKQSSPCRNLSKELTLFYWCPRVRRLKGRGGKRRRPHSPSRTIKTENHSACNSNRVRVRIRSSLLSIVQVLADRIQAAGTPPRPEVVVSPRKRFLREMEKDRLQVEDACQKRSRNKTQGVVATIPTVSAVKGSSPLRANGAASAPAGVAEEVRAPGSNCKYSITSLLAPEERSGSRRSPDHSPSHFTSPTQPQAAPFSASEDRWYSESVNRLQSIELSQVDKRALSAYSSYHYMSPYYQYPYAIPPYFSSGMYGGRYVVPPVFPHQSLPTSGTQEAPSCSWTADSSKDAEHREENVTDMPLNLSKHAG